MDNVEKYKTVPYITNVETIINKVTGIDKTINISPRYQRNIVWDETKMSNFINSVILGIVPNNIIFNLDTETGEEVCIDGKQRITSLVRFKNNQISVTLNGNKYFYDQAFNPGMILSIKNKNIFNRRRIPIVMYEDLSYKNQVLIFNKLQNGVSLKPGELIAAIFKSDDITDTFIKFGEEHKKTLSKFVKNTHRKKHLVFIADLMYIACYGIKSIQIPLKKSKREPFLADIKNVDELNKILNKTGRLINGCFNVNYLNDNRYNKLPKNVCLTSVLCVHTMYENGYTILNYDILNYCTQTIRNIYNKNRKINTKTIMEMYSVFISEFNKYISGI